MISYVLSHIDELMKVVLPILCMPRPKNKELEIIYKNKDKL